MTPVHYTSEHWREMRCGGSCNECQDVSAGLEVCRRFDWVQMNARPVADPEKRHILHHQKHHHCHRRLLSMMHHGHLLRRSSHVLPGKARGLLILRGLEPKCRNALRRQQMSMRAEETSPPSTVHGRNSEDDRDRKLQELTATVEKLANVIEQRVSKTQKTERVEPRPKHRSRTPRRRRRDSRSNSRTPARGPATSITQPT